MKAYTFFKIADRLGVPNFEIEHFKNEAEATRYARKLLSEEPYVVVEIWDGVETQRLVAEITASSLDAPRSKDRKHP